MKSKPDLVAATQSWRRHSPEYEYYFFNDAMCDHFMKTEMIPIFGHAIYQIYRQMPLNVMRADLWRYCVLYRYGGIYADADTVCKVHPSVFTNHESFLVCTPEGGGNNFLCQWAFAAPAQSPVLRTVIGILMNRVRETPVQYVKNNFVHYYTGPSMFSDGVDLFLKRNGMATRVPATRMQYANVFHGKPIHCLDPTNFHTNMILHLFLGSDPVDGWKPKRDRQVLYMGGGANIGRGGSNPRASAFFSFPSLATS